MSDCQISVEYNVAELVKGIAKHIEVKFLDKESTPTSVGEIMEAAHHVTKSIGNQIKELSTDGKFLAMIARELGFHKFLDANEEIDKAVKDHGMSEELADLLKSILKELKKRGE